MFPHMKASTKEIILRILINVTTLDVIIVIRNYDTRVLLLD
jgi:hypothetical protein